MSAGTVVGRAGAASAGNAGSVTASAGHGGAAEGAGGVIGHLIGTAARPDGRRGGDSAERPREGDGGCVGEGEGMATRQSDYYTAGIQVFNIDKSGMASNVNFRIHLLVLHTIKSNREKGAGRTADHIGRNKLDNRRRALMWATVKEQSANDS